MTNVYDQCICMNEINIPLIYLVDHRSKARLSAPHASH